MEIKVGNIVRSKDTDEVYEVVGIIGEMLLCDAVNSSNKDPELLTKRLPFLREEIEVIMDESTETFDMLFRNEDET